MAVIEGILPESDPEIIKVQNRQQRMIPLQTNAPTHRPDETVFKNPI